MSVDIRNTAYIPTIFLRGSELQAVAELPDSSKDILTPVFCLKPWKTAKLLSRSMEQIEKAYGDRPYFLDIDPFDPVKEVKRQSQEEFLELVDDTDKHQSWVEFFDDYPNAFPCLQVKHGNLTSIQNQITEFTKREKVFLVRIERENGTNFSSVIEAVCNTEHSNFGFVVDVGWSTDLLSLVSWADGIVKQIVDQRGDDIPVVVTGSSFPNNFVKMELGQEVPLQERALFSQLQGNNNRARLIYGDWGSSRCPTEGGGGGNPIPPRIDLPTGRTWEIYRCKEEDGGFKEAAENARASKNYPSDLHIWATYMIDATELGDPNGIKSLQKATAVRINMHLYRQLHFANFDPAPDTDDDFIE